MESVKQELALAEQQLQEDRGFAAMSFLTRAFGNINRIIASVPTGFRPPELGAVVQSSMEEVAKVAQAVGASGFNVGGGMTSGIYFELQFDVEKLSARDEVGRTSEE